jgi:uncharacterized protein involved in exopolysaccharide biosynthesis
MVILRRQRIWVIGIVLASLLIGYAFVRFTTPVYETSTTILIQGSSSGGNNQDPVSNVSLPVPMMSMATQMQILQSPALLSQTYEKINVAPESLDQRKPDVKVSQMGETAMLQLSVQSTDPNLAKQIAEVLPLQFQAYMRDDRQTEVQNSIDFLNDSIREQKALLQADQKNLSEYRRQLDLPLVMGQAGDRSARHARPGGSRQPLELEDEARLHARPAQQHRRDDEPGELAAAAVWDRRRDGARVARRRTSRLVHLRLLHLRPRWRALRRDVRAQAATGRPGISL